MTNILSVFEAATAASPSNIDRRRTRFSPAEQLYRDLQAHHERQTALLRETTNAIGLARTPLVSFVLGQVEDSGARQLKLLDRMGSSLQDALNWTFSPDALPDGAIEQERAAAIESLQKVLQFERESGRSARRLAKAYATINGGLERALLEASAASSDRNVRLLRMLIDRLAGVTRQTPGASISWAPQRTVDVRNDNKSEPDEDRPAVAA